MTRFNLKNVIQARSTIYNVYVNGDKLKIAQLGPTGNVVSEIYISLDGTMDLCDRLDDFGQFYRAFRPLPENGVLRREELVVPESQSTYQLELSVVHYRQHLKITQVKSRATRTPNPCITIRDTARFQSQLLQTVNEICEQLPLMVVHDNGIQKMARENRIAVIYCKSGPWPWNVSFQSEALLFEPTLVNKILYRRGAHNIRKYCERQYPQLMTEFYVDMNDTTSANNMFKDLEIRWIRQGSRFRINNSHRRPVVDGEDQWYTA